jgi:hypothetical protein
MVVRFCRRKSFKAVAQTLAVPDYPAASRLCLEP